MSTSSTSAVDAASRLPVGSSARTRRGSFASARAIATRCFSPPLSARGRCEARACSPTASEQVTGSRSPPPGRHAGDRQRQLDVLERGQLAEETEVLEYESHRLPPVAGEIVAIQLSRDLRRRRSPCRSWAGRGRRAPRAAWSCPSPRRLRSRRRLRPRCRSSRRQGRAADRKRSRIRSSGCVLQSPRRPTAATGHVPMTRAKFDPGSTLSIPMDIRVGRRPDLRIKVATRRGHSGAATSRAVRV